MIPDPMLRVGSALGFSHTQLEHAQRGIENGGSIARDARDAVTIFCPGAGQKIVRRLPGDVGAAAPRSPLVPKARIAEPLADPGPPNKVPQLIRGPRPAAGATRRSYAAPRAASAIPSVDAPARVGTATDVDTASQEGRRSPTGPPDGL